MRRSIRRAADYFLVLFIRSLAALLPPRLMRSPRFFAVWERRGYHVTPVHFYQPIPDTTQLPDHLWTTPDSLVGIEMRDLEQLSLLDSVRTRYQHEYRQFPPGEPTKECPFYIENGWFVSVDAEILYSLVRHLRPKRIIEIGSGFSTILTSLAIDKNRSDDAAYDCQSIAIDPYSRRNLLAHCKNLSRLIEQPVQDVPLAEFLNLGPNDILFIDSSHVSKVGSDVNHEIFELLPRLNSGVFVHLHDIFLPFEYPKKWYTKYRLFWNEQYLLRAFLSFNSAYEVVWAGYYMHWKYSGKLAESFDSYNRSSTTPGSFWVRRI
jgi:predicted O-methyltransferase YrrM